MDANDAYHIQTGRPMIVAGDPFLQDDRDLWAEVWDGSRRELLPEWIAGHPGSRPPAWHEFDRSLEPGEDESEVDYLHRTGELSPAEVEAIRKKALGLVAFNRGRRPERPNDHFIPPGDLESFAARVGLLSEAERSILLLDGEGVYLYRGRVPKFDMPASAGIL